MEHAIDLVSVGGVELSPDGVVAEAEKDARKKGADAIFVNEGPNGQDHGGTGL